MELYIIIVGKLVLPLKNSIETQYSVPLLLRIIVAFLQTSISIF